MPRLNPTILKAHDELNSIINQAAQLPIDKIITLIAEIMKDGKVTISDIPAVFKLISLLLTKNNV